MASSQLVYVLRGQLKIHPILDDFVNLQLLPGTGVTPERFWSAFDRLVHSLAPRNRALLARRDFLQQQIDEWHRQNPRFEAAAYRQFLCAIGYLQPIGDCPQIGTRAVDREIAQLAGPQLVVPATNARFVLNACNARWGSLYDALYGTDVIDEEGGAERLEAGYNPARGARVVEFGRDFLDFYFPLATGSYHQLKAFHPGTELILELDDGTRTQLLDPVLYRGYSGSARAPSAILLRHHGLHLEIRLDPTDPIGARDPAGVRDLILEAALTTIVDCEDSVAAVDAADKVLAYRHWLGVMRGTLTEEVAKEGRTFTRTLNPDRLYTGRNGERLTLPGRSLLLVRNVGLLMTTDAVLDRDGTEVPEGLLDGMVTAAAALHDLRRSGSLQNSRTGSVYIVKPKLHGPDEVAFTNRLFDGIEDALDLPRHTLKLGIMDEERRTSLNLRACIGAARERVVFINTGFLDRTGDEIHTSMEAGPFAPKNRLKSLPWLAAYERRNLATGLACGFHGTAQIGKGMWPQPDNMAEMLKQKIVQPKAGANTAWVPSPTAATLHAIHYHEVDVAAVQTRLLQQLAPEEDHADLVTMLQIPLLGDAPLTAEEIQRELENNCQGILGYVVRWIDQGIGCSKVPDINNTALMEDRATLRISSQHITNWLHHGICSAEQVKATLQAMARVVDRQNAADPAYRPMAENLSGSPAFAAASDLIFQGRTQPNGYTEPVLHHYRRKVKYPEAPAIHFALPGPPKVCGYIPE